MFDEIIVSMKFMDRWEKWEYQSFGVTCIVYEGVGERGSWLYWGRYCEWKVYVKIYQDALKEISELKKFMVNVKYYGDRKTISEFNFHLEEKAFK